MEEPLLSREYQVGLQGFNKKERWNSQYERVSCCRVVVCWEFPGKTTE